MLHREACFACTTPYQVMGAISIALQEKLKADIYIFGMFPRYKEVADRLEPRYYGFAFAVGSMAYFLFGIR